MTATNSNHDSLIMPHVLPADDDMFLDPAFMSTTDLTHDFDGLFFAAADPSLGQLDPAVPGAIDDGFLPDAADWNLPVGAHETAFAAAATATATAATPSPSPSPQFFVKNGAYRPPEPCVQCRRQRLQCLILQTTDANPNPITSCSSCVALFRDCSLAERGKRQASSFETSRPVIGHLHGVSEEEGGYNHHYTTGITAAALASLDEKEEAQQQRQQQQSSRPLEVVTSKRAGTRAAKKTRPLSNWFARNLGHPYPSDDQKADLASQCGLSRTQVINWFANARRRHRLSAQSLFSNGSGSGSGRSLLRQGSPMPRSALDSMSPMERWRNSPPNDEPASASAIERALNRSPPLGAGSSEYFGSYGSARDAGSACSSGSGDSGGTTHCRHRRRGRRRSSFYRASSTSFGGSAHSQQSAGDLMFVPYSANNSVDGDSNSIGKRSPTTAAPRPGSKGTTTTTFQCTFCLQTFRKRYDWVRHERSIHLPGLDSWVCRVPLPPDQSFLVWRVSHEHPECIFCGEPSPTHDHIQSHEFQTCAERTAAERTFTRKDHLWQHLHKFHHCRKWEGWRPDLALLQHKQDRLQSRCGFCSVTMNSWEERAQHLASHFRRGATMAEWSGGPGIRLPSEEEKIGGKVKG
ncbi:Homeodomain-related protein [Cordyceps fumosorosea ARSEF 2679]|uniref:Homeodomain-related protein n=1 Tax=Cordyceps fumosorosea (strain ARSEF 2679) TaxID=1081104 RepID=A0A168AT51_CORFA|nr:Homeodomain-related protein [Cordyceps fumosorosea ARSEF 2679]OAA69160.1 Homeodomain-related protein [Cordyceps fumosorosea ARSEF 2679]